MAGLYEERAGLDGGHIHNTNSYSPLLSRDVGPVVELGRASNSSFVKLVISPGGVGPRMRQDLVYSRDSTHALPSLPLPLENHSYPALAMGRPNTQFLHQGPSVRGEAGWGRQRSAVMK